MVPQYPVSQTGRFGVVGLLTLALHFMLAGMIPNAVDNGYVQFATLLLCMAIPLTAAGVFLDQPKSRVSRVLLFFVCGLCSLVALFDAVAWIKPIMKAKGWL